MVKEYGGTLSRSEAIKLFKSLGISTSSTDNQKYVGDNQQNGNVNNNGNGNNSNTQQAKNNDEILDILWE